MFDHNRIPKLVHRLTLPLMIFAVVLLPGCQEDSAERSEDTSRHSEPYDGDNPEAGMWVAPYYTGSIAQLRLTHEGGSQWTVHAWGFCSPNYCDWGSNPAERLDSGEIYAVWDWGWLRTEMFAYMSEHYPGKLEAFWWDDFSEDDGREDRGSVEVYVRQN